MGENITPQTAHEIALKLAEFYKDFEVLIDTHVDTDHIHSHFIINAVSYETSRKLHQSASVIQELPQKFDTLCMEDGLSICKPPPIDSMGAACTVVQLESSEGAYVAQQACQSQLYPRAWRQEWLLQAVLTRNI